MRKTFPFLLILAVACAPTDESPAGGAPGDGSSAGAPNASSSGTRQSEGAMRMRSHVEFLAADELAGRDIGEPGIEEAERYVRDGFDRYGLEPLPGQDDFFVPFDVYKRSFDPERTTMAVAVGPESLTLSAGADFRPFAFSESGTEEAEVVFAGYGITAPEHGWDDYDGLDVRGRFVLVFRHEPGENDPGSPFAGTEDSPHAFFEAKARVAAAHGAAGMILVSDPLFHGPREDLSLESGFRIDETREASENGILAVQVHQKAAKAMAHTSGSALSDLQKAVDGGTRPADLRLAGVSARITVVESNVDPVPNRNVAAFLEGSDPELADEWIVVGGHHDHLGIRSGEGDVIFNGADDNASGVAGVLELAKMFAEGGGVGRSLAFVTFSAEEKGALGSKYLLREKILPPDKVVFMLNMDMIGRNRLFPVHAFGDGLVEGLGDVVAAMSRSVGLEMALGGTEHFPDSDHYPFYDEGIPYLYLTTRFHGDYHGVGDHVDKVAFDHMDKIVRLAYGVLEEIADRPEPPVLMRPGSESTSH